MDQALVLRCLLPRIHSYDVDTVELLQVYTYFYMYTYNSVNQKENFPSF